MSIWHDLLNDYTFRSVALGSMLLGVVAGVLGAFAVLRKQGLMGDALSHASLPGLCIAFLLTGSKAPLVLLIGGGLAGWLATLLMLRAVRTTRLSSDAMLGVTLSIFFGFGILLLTMIQHRPGANKAGLDRFLLGQAATLVGRDVRTFAFLGALAMLVVFLGYKEFKLICFDPDFAATLGYPTHIVSATLSSLLVVAVMIGLQTVGVVLMAALVIGPGTAARLWTSRLRRMLVLSGLIGGLSGFIGAAISVRMTGVPTGPAIILVLTAMVTVSLLVAPERGLIAETLRRRRQRAKFLSQLRVEKGVLS